jgi:hypothetical protein
MKVILFSVVLGMSAALLAQDQADSVSGVTKEDVVAKLTKKIVPTVEFKKMSPADCLEWLKKEGVSLETTPGFAQETSDIRLTLFLRNVSALEALKQITSLSGTKFEIIDGKVMVGGPAAIAK